MFTPTIDQLNVNAHEDDGHQLPVKQTRVAERVTVNLSERSAAALARLAQVTGDTKTEAINKALQAYALIQAAQHNGGAMWLQDDADSESVQVRFY